MAKRWLRGPEPVKNGTNWSQITRGVMILLYFYYRYLLGYTYIDSKGTFDFDGCQDDEGTDGVLTNSDFTFTAASANFQVGTDEAKFIVILDTTNEVNCGIYKITAVNSTTEVVIDYYSSSYPVAATNLSWWLVDSTIGSSLTTNEGVVFDAAHSSGASWTMYMHIQDAGNAESRPYFEFSSGDDSWDAVAHDWKGSAVRFSRELAPHSGYAPSDLSPKIYAYGDTDFNLFLLAYHINAGADHVQGAGWCVLDLAFETVPAHNPDNRFYVFGMNGTNSNVDANRDGSSSAGIDYGRIRYQGIYSRFYTTIWSGWYMWNGSAENVFELFRQSYNAPNHRDGTEFDGMPIWVCLDYNVNDNYVWQLLGIIPKDHLWLTVCHGIGNLTLFGSDQYMHFTEGITFPWPGIPKG